MKTEHNYKFIFVIIILTFSISVSATSIDSLLSTVMNDYKIESQTEKVQNIRKLQSGIPLIDKMEFRVDDVSPFSQTVDWQDRMRYSIRISPDAIGETKAERELHNSSFNRAKHKETMIFASLLRNRYNLIIDYIDKQNQISRTQELSTLYEDRIKVLEKKVNDADFEFEMLINSEDDYTKTQLSLIEKKNELKMLGSKIQLYCNNTSEVSIDTSDLISIDSLYVILCKSPVTVDSSNMYLKDCILDLQEAKNRYKYEQASFRDFISYLEIEYDQDKYHDEFLQKEGNEQRLLSGERIKKDYDYSKAFRIGIGLTIPYVNTKRNDLVKSKVNLIDADANYNETKYKLLETANSIRGEIRTLVDQYSFIMNRKNEIRTEKSLEKYIQIEGEDPLKLLAIKESILKSEQMMDNIRYDIYRKYIKMVDITGKLTISPIKNYLSKNMSVIE